MCTICFIFILIDPFDGGGTDSWMLSFLSKPLLRLKKKKKRGQLGSTHICLIDEVRRSGDLKTTVESKSHIPMHEKP